MPSGKALQAAERTTSVRFSASFLQSLHKLWFMDSLVAEPPAVNETLKWLTSLLLLMQKVTLVVIV